MFRFAIAVLAAIGLGALLFGGAEGFAAGAGLLILAPLFIVFKIMFFLMIFGMFKYGISARRGSSGEGPWGWRPRRPATRSVDRSENDRFDEWHRLQHAKDEVDSWVDPEL